MCRTAILAGLVLAALALSAFAREEAEKKDEGKDKGKEKPKAPVYKTPQECFDAGTKAFGKGEYKTWVGCLAPVARKEFAATFGVEFVETRAQIAGLKDKDLREALFKKNKPVFGVLDKHGLTEKATREVKLSKDPKENEKARKAALELVKDPEAFLIDFLGAFDSIGGMKETGKVEEKLTGVKVEGDKATATIVRTIKGKDDKEVETKEKVRFVKVDGSWRMILKLEQPGETKDDDKKKKDKDEDK